MKEIRSRDVQMFVAGAMSVMGFRALLSIPYYFAVVRDSSMILVYGMAGLGLPIGLGMLFGNARALRWALFYLGLGSLNIPFLFLNSVLHLPLLNVSRVNWINLSMATVPLILFLMLIWGDLKNGLSGNQERR